MKEKDVHTVSIKGMIHKACTSVSEQVLTATDAHISRTFKNLSATLFTSYYDNMVWRPLKSPLISASQMP